MCVSVREWLKPIDFRFQPLAEIQVQAAEPKISSFSKFEHIAYLEVDKVNFIFIFSTGHWIRIRRRK